MMEQWTGARRASNGNNVRRQLSCNAACFLRDPNAIASTSWTHIEHDIFFAVACSQFGSLRIRLCPLSFTLGFMLAPRLSLIFCQHLLLVLEGAAVASSSVTSAVAIYLDGDVSDWPAFGARLRQGSEFKID
jgi:hypothetical protein